MKTMGRQSAIWLSILASLGMAGCGGSSSGTSKTLTTPTITWATPSPIVYGAALSSTQLDASSGGVAGTFAYSPAVGTVLTAGSQTLSVTFTPTDTTDYTSATGSVTLVVNKTAPTVSWATPSPIVYGTALSSTQLDASSGGVAGTFAYSPAVGTVLTAGSQTLSVTFTPTDTTDYNTVTGSVSVTVSPALPTVTVTPGSSSITVNQSLSVAVTVSGGSGNPTPTGGITLSSGTYTSAVTLLTAGSASINVPAGSLAAGSDTLTASYTPDASSSPNYKSASGTAPLTVTALIIPAVTVTPGSNSITTAQALTVTVAVSGGGSNPAPTGSATLSSGTYTSAATTLTAGSASINVPAGSLAAGTDTLTASYTPDANGSTNYKTASGTASVTVTSTVTYVLTVDSAAPSSGISVTVSPSDNTGAGAGTTQFTRTYNSGTAVTLAAAATSGSNTFSSWTGCATATTVTCNLTMSANTTVTASYAAPAVTSIAVTPGAATIGTPQQFTANVNGTGSYSKAVTWSLTCSSCGALSPGTLSSSGLYTTPYPAPASVTITATSAMAGFTNVSGSATVTLSPPATATGPALTVNVGSPGNPINPDIYGMDAYLLHGTAADATAVANASITIDRWGGDSTERYNYQLDVTSSIADWYFENQAGTGGDGWPAVNGFSAFDALVENNNSSGIKTLGTVPVLGWVAKDNTSCSFPVATYPGQEKVDTSRECGNGVLTATGDNITGNSPTLTSIAKPPPAPPAASAATTAWAEATWAGGWTEYLVNKFGAGNSATGVAIYDLDNEPSWWDAEDFDVHPHPFTYDEVTNGGIGTALAIKTVDPTAQVSGPVMDYWWDYFYSKEDVEDGWSGGGCGQPWSKPLDREAHGGVPFIEYYLQQMAAAQTTYGVRLLDYLDLHTYFAADYPASSGNSVAITTAGDTGAQQARLNSTRAFWDTTYTDASGNYPQPNYTTDPNYTKSCSPPQQPPQLIRMMKTWVANDYPGTKTAIDEYNWGGMESINGALAQADILGIFGREGLDLGTMWPTTDPSAQIPGMMAFAIYRNYDGNKSTFGNTVLPSTSISSGNDAEGQLAIYGAQRASDNAITVMVINKTYGALTSTISLQNFTAVSGTTAQVYQYSNANLNKIVLEAGVSVTPPSGSGTASTIANYTFPAQSITLFVVPY
jgi:hypothetical protein